MNRTMNGCFIVTYSLQIQFDQNGLLAIAQADMQVALFQPQASMADQIVAILSTATNNMTITWTSSLSIYASTYPLTEYTVPQITSPTPQAVSGQTFSYDGTAMKVIGNSAPLKTVQLVNKTDATLVGGVARAFTVNGTPQDLGIVTAASLLNNGLGTFSTENIFMLTLMSGASLGMAIPTNTIPNFNPYSKKLKAIPPIAVQPALELNFDTGGASQTVHYDDQSSIFVLGPLA